MDPSCGLTNPRVAFGRRVAGGGFSVWSPYSWSRSARPEGPRPFPHHPVGGDLNFSVLGFPKPRVLCRGPGRLPSLLAPPCCLRAQSPGGPPLISAPRTVRPSFLFAASAPATSGCFILLSSDFPSPGSHFPVPPPQALAGFHG